MTARRFGHPGAHPTPSIGAPGRTQVDQRTGARVRPMPDRGMRPAGATERPAAESERIATPGQLGHDDEVRLALRAWLRMLTCTNLIERNVRQQLRDKFDTTLPRFDVLAQLDAASHESQRGLTMSDLSRRLMVTNGNLTSLIERLVRERLVSRTAVATDRRAQLVKLTPLGKAALDAMTPDHHAWIDTMFGALSHDERTQLHQLLGKLKDSLPWHDATISALSHDR